MLEYLIYCDESEKRGLIFSNFYGGALVRSIHVHEVVNALERYKKEHNINGELKWTKVSEQYLEKYIGFIDVFFDFIAQDKVKMRVMFTQNSRTDDVVRHLTKEQRENSYFLLYYQFIKHAFGLRYANPKQAPINMKLFFDQFPDTKEKVMRFKEFIFLLQRQDAFRAANLRIEYDNIIEVVSHDHVILQASDIVTGAMYFRLNKLHLVIPPGQKRRGKKTKAKERLYNHISKRIREIYPGFNCGANTGKDEFEDLWYHSYRHWLFRPKETNGD